MVQASRSRLICLLIIDQERAINIGIYMGEFVRKTRRFEIQNHRSYSNEYAHSLADVLGELVVLRSV